ncbi:hypothetical protein PoB_000386800 [Plakobranchus ocellatus]|uniref:Uncharacterized protein n=1 Tax=Plakobranchus ocellatus TaxID=259542 RepID=A0AAV3Y595_9GAST|nr:hypothetical protein PoB_000386800 [Plakobranchus ocellatus]
MARTSDRRVPADNRSGSLYTVPPRPRRYRNICIIKEWTKRDNAPELNVMVKETTVKKRNPKVRTGIQCYCAKRE